MNFYYCAHTDSFPCLHFMLQLVHGVCYCLTSIPSKTVSSTVHKSAPTADVSFQGLISQIWIPYLSLILIRPFFQTKDIIGLYNQTPPPVKWKKLLWKELMNIIKAFLCHANRGEPSRTFSLPDKAGQFKFNNSGDYQLSLCTYRLK